MSHLDPKDVSDVLTTSNSGVTNLPPAKTAKLPQTSTNTNTKPSADGEDGSGLIDLLPQKLNTHRRDLSYKRRLSLLAERAPVLLLAIDINGRVLSANRRCTNILGISAIALNNRILFEYMSDDAERALRMAMLEVSSRLDSIETTIKLTNDVTNRIRTLTAWVSQVEFDGQGTPEYFISLVDASRQQKLSEQLKVAKEYMERLATHDALTGLPNRIHFTEALRRSMLSARKSNRKIALFYFDIDGFKKVNDQYGHYTGDELLREVSNRLRNRTRDVGNLARLGGDEFTLIVRYSGNQEALTKEADKILRTISEPLTIASVDIKVSTSIGIAMYPEYAKLPKELIHFADAAMYRAKQAGGNRAVIFCAEQHRVLHKKSCLEHEFKMGIDYSQFYLNFQPLVNCSTGKVVAFEVLSRWNHPDFGMIEPELFISIAEGTRQISQLSDWVMEQSIEVCGKHLLKNRDIRFAINISSAQLCDPNLPKKLMSLLEKHHVPPSNIELEITEYGLIDNLEEAQLLTKDLTDMGCTLAVDDFGTGHSSLARLITLPISKIKLDKLLISELKSSKSARIIIRGVVAVSHELGLKVVAEGVETKAQLNMLRNMGCDIVQGFGLLAPVDERKLAAAHAKTYIDTGVSEKA